VFADEVAERGEVDQARSATEQDIIRAGAEGRITGGVDVPGK
jgi:hypothetical protein